MQMKTASLILICIRYHDLIIIFQSPAGLMKRAAWIQRLQVEACCTGTRWVLNDADPHCCERLRRFHRAGTQICQAMCANLPVMLPLRPS